MSAATLLVVLARSASTNCGWGYSCCCQEEIIVSVDCHCVEDEPGLLGKNNCARDGGRASSPVADATRQVCKNRPSVTRAQLEAAEEAERQWAKDAAACETGCKENEEAWYDDRHCQNNDPKGMCETGGDVGMGCQCVCKFPNGRDEQGACVPCPHGYVNRTKDDTPPGPGAKAFKNGEFHCAPQTAILV